MCALKSIQALCLAGADAHASGDAMNADFLLHQAYAQAKRLNSPVLEAKILNTMAAFAMEDMRTDAAIPLLLQARDKVDAKLGQNNKLYTAIASNLRQAQGRTENAAHNG